ncbi:homing endonuclease associated repeat-containing protein [Paenibacillus sp. Y412MC10]|uniref:homing endonuclease associated repeat-containing protein n=1 Tax=Geobacillus sp. (strain Y412MC10) TaxID=481743 RepID=UPI0011AB637E|nr:hypothetical protein [Paenibacillus sp. Y412MC10]
MNLDIINELLEIAKSKLYAKYGTGHSLSKSDIVMMVLYMYCKEKGIALQQECFFDDQYFEQNFVLREDKVYEKISGLHRSLGRLPTSREYSDAGGEFSLSYLKSCFGSYSKALDSYLVVISQKDDS